MGNFTGVNALSAVTAGSGELAANQSQIFTGTASLSAVTADSGTLIVKAPMLTKIQNYQVINEKWTIDIAYNASVTTIQTALEELYGAGNVIVTGLVYEDNFCNAATDSNYIKTEFLHRGTNTNGGWIINETTCQLRADGSNDDLGIHTNPAIINIPESSYYHIIVEYLGTSDNDGAGILVYDDIKKEWWCGSITNDHGINGIGYYTASGGNITSVVSGANYDVKTPHTLELFYENGILSFYVDSIKSCEHSVDLTISGAGVFSDACDPPPYFDSIKIYTWASPRITFDYSVGDSNLEADFTGLTYE